MKTKKPILKITSLFLIIGLNCSGLFGVGETMACFNDKEISENNIYTAGTLDFSLHSGQNDFMPETGHKNRATRTMQVHQEGNLPFKYRIRTEITGGDSNFCETLELEAKLKNEVKYPVTAGGENGLTGLNFPPVEIIDPPGVDAWQFKINAQNNSQNKTCEFKFVFEGWQDNIENYEENGFDDVEEIENSFSSSGQQNLNWVEVVRPNGGEVWYTVPDSYIESNWWCGKYKQRYDMDDDQCRYHIKWSTSADIPEGEGAVDIWFCNESGGNCFYHITADGPTENDGVYEWRIPFGDDRFIGDEDRIKIVISGISGGESVSDMTDENFCPLIPPFEPFDDDLELLDKDLEEDIEELNNLGDEVESDVSEEIGVEDEEVIAEEDDLDDDDMDDDEEKETEETVDEDDDKEEDAKEEEFVLTPKEEILSDDDTGDDDDVDDEDNNATEESVEELESEVKEEIEKINNDSNNSEDNNTENNLNKNSVDCVQAVN